VNHEEISLSAAVTFVPDKSCLASREYGDIHLTPNERRLLELIISGKSKKETIFEEIWHSQGTIVSESSYHQLIKMLRRKLQYAGLPGSIIKTIPRYGIVLAPCEPAASLVVSDASTTDDATCEEICLDAAQPALQSPQLSAYASRWLLIISAAVILLSPLCVPLLMEKPQAFQERITVDGVTFHFSSRRSIDRAGLAQKRQALPEGINNVYIAANGPKVFVAQCEGELSKEGKCRYEYYSSY
jgi:DNA-binding winged helix-turn-helix (wHTH) protein